MFALLDAWPPVVILLVSIAILVLSCGAFWILSRQLTTRRRRLELIHWAQSNGYHVHRYDGARTPPVLEKSLDAPRALMTLENEKTVIAQIETGAAPGSGEPGRSFRWNLVVRHIAVGWPTTGLRPSSHRTSVLDFFAMTSFPSLISSARFVIFGTDTTAAVALAGSQLRGLLPADVGLLLHESHLILDFSTRPFDPLELQRMSMLVEQIVAHLPRPTMEHRR
jgi:hypothetical protein